MASITVSTHEENDLSSWVYYAFLSLRLFYRQFFLKLPIMLKIIPVIYCKHSHNIKVLIQEAYVLVRVHNLVIRV